MIGIEWEVPASLTTTAGTLNFNTYPGLILDPGQCAATKDIRPPKDPVPQGDGDIIHHRWLTGYVYKLVARAFTAQDTPACDDDARLLIENLGLHLSAMLNYPGRYCWLPTNYSNGTRALDEARWFSGVIQSLSEGGIYQVEFEIDSPFPYVIDLFQTSPTISGSGTITNSGNTNFYPVMQVQGPSIGFIIQNDTQEIVYGTGGPGQLPIPAGSYAEIDSYKGTIYMNGDGADLSAGIDPLLTSLEDPFILRPGINNMSSVGADTVFLVNSAWA